MRINLNLIPSYRKEEIEMAKNRKVFIWQFIAVFSLFFISFLALNIFNNSLREELESFSFSLVSKSGEKEMKELENYDKEFNDVNSKTSTLVKIQEEQYFWSSFFMKLNGIINSKIAIDNVITKKMQVTITGLAETRDDLLVLKNNLEKEKCFENINLPLSNFAAKEKLNFQLNFQIKEDCIKNHEKLE